MFCRRFFGCNLARGTKRAHTIVNAARMGPEGAPCATISGPDACAAERCRLNISMQISEIDGQGVKQFIETRLSVPAFRCHRYGAGDTPQERGPAYLHGCRHSGYPFPADLEVRFYGRARQGSCCP